MIVVAQSSRILLQQVQADPWASLQQDEEDLNQAEDLLLLVGVVRLRTRPRPLDLSLADCLRAECQH